MSIRPGIRLGDRYQLLTPIATGGMGQVWRAEDTTLHRVVAAKVLRSEYTGDPTFLARFRAEAQNSAALSHPNVASVYDYGETVQESERLAYLVMELVEGEPLVEILHKRPRLPVAQTLDILQQAATGLDAAHRTGMVHRDIKPGNLIIRPDGVVKITDFGIARAANTVPLTDSGTVVGTAQYLAPEQAEGRPAMAASDVYALGVVGYECLAGFRPFDGDNSVAIALSQIRDLPRPLPQDVPPAVRDLIQHAMAKNAQVRLANGAAFATAIASVRAGLGAGSGSSTGLLPIPGAGLNPASQTLTAAPRLSTPLQNVPAPGAPGPAGGRPAGGPPGTSGGPGPLPQQRPPQGPPPGAPQAGQHQQGPGGSGLGPPTGGPRQAPYPGGPARPGSAVHPSLGPPSSGVPSGPPSGYPVVPAPESPDGSRRNTWIAVAVGVVILVVIAVVVFLVLRGDPAPTRNGQPTSTTSAVPHAPGSVDTGLARPDRAILRAATPEGQRHP